MRRITETPGEYKPIIWTVAMSRLSHLLRDITLEYDQHAQIEAIHLGFDDAVQAIRERMETQRCDAIIAAGSNAAYLKSRLSIPVVIIKASGFDVMQALARARKLSPKIGIVSYQQAMPELAEFMHAFDCAIEQRTYTTIEDARAQINELQASGIRAVVGAGLITDLAVAAGMHGVFMYSADSARQAIEHALELLRLRPGKHWHEAVSRQPGVQALRGQSAPMEALRQDVLLYAKSPATVLIEGETGTGKELVAQAIHRELPNTSKIQTRGVERPFVAVNCGALAESLLEAELFGYEEGAFTGSRRGGHAGLFEAAHQGTLFLDEIGEMPLTLQTRLLRVLEERAVVRVGGTKPIPLQLRVICATHCDLATRVSNGQFRADLYYRIAVLRLHLPALRERSEDVPELAAWCLKNALAALSARSHANLHAELQTCASLLCAYAWPGNVRQLRNIMERLALYLAEQPLQALTPAFLLAIAPELAEKSLQLDAPIAAPNTESNSAAINQAAAETRVATIAEVDEAAVLASFGGRREAAAQHLGISRSTLWRRLQKRSNKKPA